MKEKIKKILRKHAKNQINLHSETAREVIATEIIECLEQDRGLDFNVKDTYKAQGEALKSKLEDE